jgi:hypothetical protein
LGKKTLASGAARRRSAGTASAAVRLRKAGRKALRGRSSRRMTLTVTLTQGSSKLTVKRKVVLRRGAGLKRIASRGLRLVAAATRSCRLTAKLTISAKQARRLDLAARGRVTLASARISAGRAPKLLVLRASGRKRRVLAQAKRVATRLETVAGAAGEPLRTAKLSKTLLR